MEIKLSRLKQIISEVVEERHASERMDNIIQSTREEEVDPHDQAIDEMIAEEIEAAIEKFVVGEGNESKCLEIQATLKSLEPYAKDTNSDMGAEYSYYSAQYDKLGCGAVQGEVGSEEDALGGGSEIKPDVARVADRLGQINTPDEFAQLIDIFLDLLSTEKIQKALPTILKRTDGNSTERAAFLKAVTSHEV